MALPVAVVHEINPFLAHPVSYLLFYRNIGKLSLFNFIITDFELLPSIGIHSTFLLIDPSSGVIFFNHLEKWLLFFKGDQKAKEVVAMESSASKEAFEEISTLTMVSPIKIQKKKHAFPLGKDHASFDLFIKSDVIR